MTLRVPTIAEERFGCTASRLFDGKLGACPPGFHQQFADTPALIDAEYLAQSQRLCAALHRALCAVVTQYPHDPRIRAIYDLSPELDAILRLADGRPYHVGFYRPDLIYDRHGWPRICEIGARYPLNGWIISELSQRVLGATPACAAFRAQTEQSEFWNTLYSLHPPGSTVALIHAHEPGTEIFQVGEVLGERGVRFIEAVPGNLRLRDDRIVASCDGTEYALDRCILEMDRTELTAFTPEVLMKLVENACYFNDIRTLILVHDKRTLAVLWDEAILRTCVTADDAEILRPWLIPTWAANDASTRKAMLEHPGDLIAKRNSGGRGVDAVIRSQCGEDAWFELVSTQWRDFMFQEYLEQRDFTDPDTGQAMHLIGMILCADAVCHGAGVFRGSQEAIINVHQGRGRFYAAMMRA